MFTSVVVFIDRSGYRDVQGSPLSFLDSVYYSAVTPSTTGYGDITPVSPEARLVNIIVITPAARALPDRPDRYHPWRC